MSGIAFSASDALYMIRGKSMDDTAYEDSKVSGVIAPDGV